jgi:protein-disulfide isomerase
MSKNDRRPRGRTTSEDQTRAGTERRVRRIVLVVIGVVVIAASTYAGIQLTRPPEATITTPAPSTTSSADLTVREDSRRLNDVPDAKVTFVEFLDFECEACGAAFPAIEQLRGTYGDRVSFVIRYFPIQSHFNALRAARAVEAAAQQGQLEAMYTKMYSAQTEWAEQQVPKDDVFRGYAQELGLDMATWDTAYNATATTDRIQSDVQDGISSGVQGTPTFFLNGKLIEPQSFGELETLIKQALAE